jgi:glycosyltransferase involved in cell wall biosynthesis
MLAGAVGGVVALAAFALVTVVVDRRDLVALLARRGLRRDHPPGDGTEPGPGQEPKPGPGPGLGASVLLVLATSAGGVGRHVRALAEALTAQGWRVRVAGHPATQASFGFTACGADFCAVEVGDRPHPFRELRGVRRLRGLLAGADVVHAHGLRAAALVVLAARAPVLPGRGLRRPAVVVTLHNAPASGGAAGRVSAVLERLVARGADAVLVVSADLGERMRALGASRVERALVPAPHRDPSGPLPQVRTRTREALGVGETTALLLTVARLAPQKGLPVLVEAVARLAQGRPDGAVVAVVAGDGPLAGHLAAELAARDVPIPLRLLGARDDVADLLAAADVLVLSSLWEGQPLAVQEALRAGLPVVATDAGGTAEVTGDAALLVPPGDVAALAAALSRVVDDAGLRRDLAERAAARAGTLPTDADAVRQLLAVYAQVSPRGTGVVPHAETRTG